MPKLDSEKHPVMMGLKASTKSLEALLSVLEIQLLQNGKAPDPTTPTLNALQDLADKLERNVKRLRAYSSRVTKETVRSEPDAQSLPVKILCEASSSAMLSNENIAQASNQSLPSPEIPVERKILVPKESTTSQGAFAETVGNKKRLPSIGKKIYAISPDDDDEYIPLPTELNQGQLRKTKSFKEDFNIIQKKIQNFTGYSQKKKNMFMPHDPLVRKWDSLVLIVLVYVAIGQPLEVAFVVENPLSITPLWIVNRIVDVLFFFDMMLQFNIAILDPLHLELKKLTFCRKVVAKAYLKSWFLIDFLSVFPFGMIVTAAASADGASRLSIVRAVRLLRLIKMVRVIKATRVLKRWEHVISSNHKTLTIIKYLFGILVFSHWAACAWGILGSLQSATKATWMTSWLNSQLERDTLNKSPDESCKTDDANGFYWTDCYIVGEMYAASLHWAVMTLTSIGYGDIVPTNHEEYWVGVALMVASGIMWARVIGELCAVESTADPHGVEFRNAMDTLNNYISKHAISHADGEQLRICLAENKVALRVGYENRLMQYLSPQLRHKCIMKQYSFILKRAKPLSLVWSCMNRPEFISDFFALLHREVYAPGEIIESLEDRIKGRSSTNPRMYFLRTGLVANCGRPLLRGHSWGHDFLMRRCAYTLLNQVKSLTYAKVSFVYASEVRDLLVRYPLEQRRVRKQNLKLMMVRVLQREAIKQQTRKDFSNEAFVVMRRSSFSPFYASDT